MKKNKEMRMSIQSMLILMLSNMGMDAPENIEDITDFVLIDVQETADPKEWHSGDVAIGFRRWIEAQAKPEELVNEYCPHCEDEVRLKNEFQIQDCPTCGESIKPCSICEDEACNQCPLDNVQSEENIIDELKSGFDEMYSKPIEQYIKPEPQTVVTGNQAVIDSKISTVKELRYLLEGLDDQDQICIETCDENGDAQDLFPMYLDVIDGIQLTDGTEINEVRFCQMPNTEPDTRDKQFVIDGLIKEITQRYLDEVGDCDFNEECPECETEVELSPVFKVQECPNCGKPILPCSICRDLDLSPDSCNDCPLENLNTLN